MDGRPHLRCDAPRVRSSSERALIDRAVDGDAAAFAELTGRYGREIRAHCYRMLGSVQDAEDAAQETFVAAWRGLSGFQGRSSLRTWLYRIATHVCLRSVARGGRRLLSPDVAAPRSDVHDLGAPVSGPVWLEPWVDEPAGEDADPLRAVLERESIELAFVAALQHLSAAQRAVLLLRDVLGFSADETAHALSTSAVAVNSSLQRARATVRERVPERTQQAELAALGDERAPLVRAFADAWERADVDALVAMLADDVRFTMPPLPAWFEGRDDVARFLAERVFATPWRLTPIEINAQPAFVCEQDAGAGFRHGAINVLAFRDGRVTWIAGFVDPALARHLAHRR